MRFGSFAAVIAVVVVSGCWSDRPPQNIGPCDVSEGGSSRVQAVRAELLQRLEPVVDYFLDAAAGGPRTCHPGAVVRDDCDPCRGDAVELPVGVQTTLAIEVQNIAPLTARLSAVEVAAGSDDGFVVLAPVATEVAANAAVALFVGVTPAEEGLIDGTIEITSDANGQGAETPYAIHLQVVGVAP